MDAMNSLAQSAQHLIALTGDPGLHIESSPGAQQVLRACVADIEHAACDLSHTTAVAYDPELRKFYLAKLNDIIKSLKEMLSAIESARSLPYVAKEFITQVSAELHAIAQEVEQSQTTEGAISEETPNREMAKVIQFPGYVVDSIETVKHRHLVTRRRILIEQFEAASKQLSQILSDADKVILRHRIEDLEKEIKQLDQELEEMLN